MDSLMTQLARCCKPVPPDPIRGFVTRGKGVSVHREDCASLKRLAERQPERLIEAAWGKGEGSYTVEMAVTAADRRGLLRDIGDALSREKINVTRGAHAEPRRAGFHALHVRCRQPRAAQARVRPGARAEGRHPRGARLMDELLSNPAVQAGAAPFLAGLIVAVALRPLKLGGLAVTAAFATTVYFRGGLPVQPAHRDAQV